MIGGALLPPGSELPFALTLRAGRSYTPRTSPRTVRLFDLHAHILPAVDDGARSLDEALAMAEVAARDGSETMAATVHGVERGPGYRRQECLDRIAALQAELDGRGIPLQIAPGVETYLSP